MTNEAESAATRQSRLLGQSIMVHQLTRSSLRASAGAVAALPLLFVDDPSTADVVVAVTLAGWTLLHAGLTAAHVARFVDCVGGWNMSRADMAIACLGFLTALAGATLAVDYWIGLSAVAAVPVAAAALAVVSCVVAFTRAMPQAGPRRLLDATTFSTEQAPATGRMLGHQEHQGLAIACSGGGIRAAAFCLGGLQSLIHSGWYDRADRVYAVSGGSYVAAGLHIARRFAPGPTDAAPPQAEAPAGAPQPATTRDLDLFAPNSPEADWLRRKSSFLLPNSAAWFRGLYSVLFGLVSNLTMLFSALWLFVAYCVWVLGLGIGGSSIPVLDHPYATFEPGASPPQFGIALLGLLALSVGLAWVVAAKLWSKYARGRLPSLTPVTLAFAVGLTLLLFLLGIPSLLTLAHNAAVGNQPTAAVAKTLGALGIVDDAVCDEAVKQDFTREAWLAWHRTAAPATATTIPFSYGACGDTYSDDAVVFKAIASTGGPLDVACLGPGQWPPSGTSAAATAPRPAFCVAEGDPTKGWAARMTGVLALAGAVATVVKTLQTPAEATKRSRFGRLGAALRSTVLPWAALLAVVCALGILGARMGRHLAIHAELLDSLWTWLVPSGLILATRVVTDATVSSLHPFYRERLSDTFLVRRTEEDAAGRVRVAPVRLNDDTRVDPPASLSEATGPQLTVLCVANIQDDQFVPAQRGCVPFRFETASRPPGHAAADALPDRPEQPWIGIHDTRLPRIAPRELGADTYSRIADPVGNDTTLSAAIAASGAAFSPVMGRLSKRVRPYRLLLTLANARLGVWLPNPYYAYVKKPPPDPTPWEKFKNRLVHKPGPFRIFKEAIGRQSIYDSRIYVTDGGHFDNTGMVEALRDRPRRLIVLDASADVKDSLDALADAITTARMDLGLLIVPATPNGMAKIRSADGEPPPRPERAWVHLKAAYEAAPERTVCDIFFVKNVLSSVSDVELDAYHLEHPMFPITTTVNQFYGEYDFEAYRQLGHLNTTQMTRGAAIGRPG